MPEIGCCLVTAEYNHLKSCRNICGSWKWISYQAVCVCVFELSVANHSDPRVAWLGQGVGTQWRGCPTVAASFRRQSKSGIERSARWKSPSCCQGQCVCVCVCLSGSAHAMWVWYLFIITEHRTGLLHQRRGMLSKQNIDFHVCFHRRTSAKLLLLLQHK